MKRICDCPCHTTPGMMHAFPCCDNGIAEEPHFVKMASRIQTKQSFETFLSQMQALADLTKNPLVERLACPVCEGIMFLCTAPMDYLIEGTAWTGTHSYYQCGKCKECFTTTNSDVISMASIKLVQP
jgi:hypothetical protein